MPIETLVLNTDRDFADAMAEVVRRKQEAVQHYRAMPSQLPFHLSTASEKVARGGNRSGKSVAMLVEVASAVLGVPLHGPDGEELPFLYPRDRPLLVWLVGFDEKHIGRLYHKLFSPTLFKLIRDNETGEMRAWRPERPEDAAREFETRYAPPLIPERMIKEWAWQNKAARVFELCRLHNDTQIYAFTSGGEPATGDAVDIIAIDEAIKYPGHIAEWQARLSDNRGKLLWSSWPRMANRALKDMCDRAEKQRDLPNPDVSEICLWFTKNPYIPADEKRKRLAGWPEVERRARDRGEFVTDTTLVYPTFNPDVHCLPSKSPHDKLEAFLAKRNYTIPLDWTNYLSVDPGHAHLAVLLASVPPPEIGNYLVIWAEICTPHLDAVQVANEVLRLGVNRAWEAFYMDRHGGRRSIEGLGGVDVRDIWAEGFAKAGLESNQTGNSFAFGLDDIPARNMLIRSYLKVRDGAGPKLRFLDSATTETQKEFGLYSKRIIRDEIRDDVVDRDNHSMDALGYLVPSNPIYVSRTLGARVISPGLRAFQAWEKRHAPKTTDSVYMGPGAIPTPSATAGVL